MAKDPSFVFVETNWSLLSDCLMAYLRASSSEEDVSRLFAHWKDLMDSVGSLSPVSLSSVRGTIVAGAAALSKALPFPTRTISSRVRQVSLAIEIYKEQHRGQG